MSCMRVESPGTLGEFYHESPFGDYPFAGFQAF